jgi:hypothetical protein
MLVPKTSVYKYYFSTAGERYIGAAWQALVLPTETVAHAMKFSAQAHFYRSVLALNLCHRPTSSIFAKAFRHLKSLAPNFSHI